MLKAAQWAVTVNRFGKCKLKGVNIRATRVRRTPEMKGRKESLFCDCGWTCELREHLECEALAQVFRSCF